MEFLLTVQPHPTSPDSGSREALRFEVPNHYVDGDTFVIEMDSDFTHAETGEEIHSEQIGVYKVRDGKVVSSRFYYGYGE